MQLQGNLKLTFNSDFSPPLPTDYVEGISHSFKRHSEVSSLGGLVARDTPISLTSREPGKRELQRGEK